MAETHSRRWPSAGVIVALGLLVGGVQLSHYAGLTEFTYHVAATTQSVATDAAQSSSGQATVVYQFAELPATAQDAFLRASESANNQTTIRGMAHQVTELGHTGDTPARPGSGLYYVLYQEHYYEFVIRHPMSFGGTGILLGYPLAAIGLLYGIYISLTDTQRARSSLAVVAGVVSFLAVYGVTGWWGLNDLLSLLLVGALCAYLPAIGVWVSYESLRP
ncbi:hypothetical protein [Halobacterium litoreum]|uniref:DUF7979 domain-containing protein n=1 Tax=Halobacterium litoreum TaxID=2039234 RepID=A0ABD5NBK8_9EURY|nr:hypothetical protein [Halobacterium litoreum]UHH14600.1 hypothetical protein LT972_06260 [Halobacterium litoreum]